MEILVKANELAEALEKSPELQTLRDAEKQMKEDNEAISLMNRFQQKQMEIYNLQMAGNEPSTEQKNELDNLRTELQGNPLIMDFLHAQETIGKILEKINNAVSIVLQGNSSCGESGCAGCAGCD